MDITTQIQTQPQLIKQLSEEVLKEVTRRLSDSGVLSAVTTPEGVAIVESEPALSTETVAESQPSSGGSKEVTPVVSPEKQKSRSVLPTWAEGYVQLDAAKGLTSNQFTNLVTEVSYVDRQVGVSNEEMEELTEGYSFEELTERLNDNNWDKQTVSEVLRDMSLNFEIVARESELNKRRLIGVVAALGRYIRLLDTSDKRGRRVEFNSSIRGKSKIREMEAPMEETVGEKVPGLTQTYKNPTARELLKLIKAELNRSQMLADLRRAVSGWHSYRTGTVIPAAVADESGTLTIRSIIHKADDPSFFDGVIKYYCCVLAVACGIRRASMDSTLYQNIVSCSNQFKLGLVNEDVRLWSFKEFKFSDNMVEVFDDHILSLSQKLPRSASDALAGKLRRLLSGDIELNPGPMAWSANLLLDAVSAISDLAYQTARPGYNGDVDDVDNNSRIEPVNSTDIVMAPEVAVHPRHLAIGEDGSVQLGERTLWEVATHGVGHLLKYGHHGGYGHGSNGMPHGDAVDLVFKHHDDDIAVAQTRRGVDRINSIHAADRRMLQGLRDTLHQFPELKKEWIPYLADIFYTAKEKIRDVAPAIVDSVDNIMFPETNPIVETDEGLLLESNVKENTPSPRKQKKFRRMPFVQHMSIIGCIVFSICWADASVIRMNLIRSGDVELNPGPVWFHKPEDVDKLSTSWELIENANEDNVGDDRVRWAFDCIHPSVIHTHSVSSLAWEKLLMVPLKRIERTGQTSIPIIEMAPELMLIPVTYPDPVGTGQFNAGFDYTGARAVIVPVDSEGSDAELSEDPNYDSIIKRYTENPIVPDSNMNANTYANMPGFCLHWAAEQSLPVCNGLVELFSKALLMSLNVAKPSEYHKIGVYSHVCSDRTVWDTSIPERTRFYLLNTIYPSVIDRLYDDGLAGGGGGSLAFVSNPAHIPRAFSDAHIVYWPQQHLKWLPFFVFSITPFLGDCSISARARINEATDPNARDVSWRKVSDRIRWPGITKLVVVITGVAFIKSEMPQTFAGLTSGPYVEKFPAAYSLLWINAPRQDYSAIPATTYSLFEYMKSWYFHSSTTDFDFNANGSPLMIQSKWFEFIAVIHKMVGCEEDYSTALQLVALLSTRYRRAVHDTWTQGAFYQQNRSRIATKVHMVCSPMGLPISEPFPNADSVNPIHTWNVPRFQANEWNKLVARVVVTNPNVPQGQLTTPYRFILEMALAARAAVAASDLIKAALDWTYECDLNSQNYSGKFGALIQELHSNLSYRPGSVRQPYGELMARALSAMGYAVKRDLLGACAFDYLRTDASMNPASWDLYSGNLKLTIPMALSVAQFASVSNVMPIDFQPPVAGEFYRDGGEVRYFNDPRGVSRVTAPITWRGNESPDKVSIRNMILFMNALDWTICSMYSTQDLSEKVYQLWVPSRYWSVDAYLDNGVTGVMTRFSSPVRIWAFKSYYENIGLVPAALRDTWAETNLLNTNYVEPVVFVLSGSTNPIVRRGNFMYTKVPNFGRFFTKAPQRLSDHSGEDGSQGAGAQGLAA